MKTGFRNIVTTLVVSNKIQMHREFNLDITLTGFVRPDKAVRTGPTCHSGVESKGNFLVAI